MRWKKTFEDKNFSSVFQWSVVVVAVFVSWGALAIPIVFNQTRASYNGNSGSSSVVKDDNSSYCHLPQPYSKGVCLDTFAGILELSGCEVNAPFMVPESNEIIVRAVLNELNEINASPKCFQNMLSLVCLYWLGLCGGDRELILPTASQCEEIQLRVCAREWSLIAASGIFLPECKLFLENNYIICPSNNTVQEKASNLSCQSNFYFDEDYQSCVPSCQTWSEHGEAATITLRAFIIGSNLMGIILAIAAIVVSVIKYKSMLQFPSLFLVYSCIDILLVDICIVIGHSNINLFCNSPTILNNTVTTFCIITGIIFNYAYVQLSLWWIFHLLIVFWGVWFPLHYDQHKNNGNFKKIAISLSIAGLVTPLLAVIIVLVDYAVVSRKDNGDYAGGLGYGEFQHLPIFCVPVRVAFYSIILPLIFTLAAGGPLIFLILLRFLKRNAKAGTTEIKLMVVLCYYVLLTCANITEFTVILRNVDALFESTLSYFYCEGLRNDPTSSCSRDFEEYDVAIVTVIALIAVALYPLYVLLFTVNFRKVLKWRRRKGNMDTLKSSSFVLK